MLARRGMFGDIAQSVGRRGGLQPRRPSLITGDPMSNDVLRFEIGTLTEFVTPAGRRYLRGDIGGLRFTVAEELDREPAPGGVARWSVVASPTPGKARHVLTPLPARLAAPAGPSKVMAWNLSAAARTRAATADAIERNGALPDGGDPLDDVYPAPANSAARDAELQAAIDLLHTPVC